MHPEQEIGMRLQQVAGMTADEAKTELLDDLKDEVAHESAAIIRDRGGAAERPRPTRRLAPS